MSMVAKAARIGRGEPVQDLGTRKARISSRRRYINQSRVNIKTERKDSSVGDTSQRQDNK